MEEKLQHCELKRKKHLCYIPLRKKKLLRCGIQQKKICEPSRDCCPLYPTMEINFFRCIPQRRKTFSIVSHTTRNAAALYPTIEKKFFNLNIFTKIHFFSKMILTHESGSQEDQFDKKMEVKISRYYPFKVLTYIQTYILYIAAQLDLFLLPKQSDG
jgi:hypothetical protein